MDYVVLDTDLASLSFRGRLPSGLARPLVGKITCISFVTIGENDQVGRATGLGTTKPRPT